MILGGSGLLGLNFIKRFDKDYKILASYSHHKPNFLQCKNTCFVRLNINKTLKKLEKLFLNFKPDYVFNFLAISEIEKCEKYKNKCKKVIFDGFKKALKISKKYNCKFVHMSTDTVYNEENKIEEVNPFARGYKKYMTTSDVREDVEDLKRHSVKKKQKQIVVRYEPEAATSHKKWLDQVGLLGVEKIDDFTCQHGTDYMNAYQEPDEVQEKHKYYNSVEEIEYERSNMDYRMTKEELRRRQEWEQEQQRMEYKRRQNVKNNDNHIYDQYRMIHERLC